MAVGRPRVISAGCRAGPVGPCGRRTSLLRVHGPIIQVIFTASDDIPGGAIGSHMNFHGLIGATSSQKFGDWSFTNFSRRHSGGGHWDGVSFERKKKTSKPRNPCEHLCASLVWVTSFLDDIPGGAIGTAFLEHGMQTSQSLRTLFVPASHGSRAGLLLLSIRERIGGREFRNNPLCSRTL